MSDRDPVTDTTDRHVIKSNIDLATCDADRVADYVTRVFTPVRVVPHERAEVLRFQASGYRFGPFSIATEKVETGLDLWPKGTFEAFSIKLPLKGRAEILTGARDLHATPEAGLIVDAATYSKVTLHANLAEIAIAVTKASVVRQLTAMLDQPLQRQIQFAPNFAMTSAAGAALASIGRLLHDGLEGDAPLLKAPNARFHLADALVALMIESLEHNYSDALRQGAPVAAPRHVKSAIEFMEANAARPIAITEIAEASRTSIRALQAAFRRFKDTTPAAYLRQLRLEAVHRELADPANAETVAELARKWGFAHLGSFARQYLTHYGELPSETRRAARG